LNNQIYYFLIDKETIGCPRFVLEVESTGDLAIFHGLRKLADYDKQEKLKEITKKKAA